MDLYTIEERSAAEAIYSFKVRFNSAHPVYKGHFPTQPVTPGVLLTKMVRDLLQGARGSALQLKEAQSIKFLRPIVPETAELLNVTITVLPEEENLLPVKAQIADDTTIYFKLVAKFESESAG